MNNIKNKVVEGAGKIPGERLRAGRMPGHWLLARLGKRVLRPGGIELTRVMLDGLGIGPSDHVVEFAPGLGSTARLALERCPHSYIGVERDEAAAGVVWSYLNGPRQRCVVGNAEATELETSRASVVYGEAMLTMQRKEQKRRIVGEAHRLLAPGGRYGIHELCLVPDDLEEDTKEEIQAALSTTIRVGARPLTLTEWRALLESEGFEVVQTATAPMRLLEPGRLLKDEGLRGAARFLWNALRDDEARRRVLAMQGVFRRYRPHLAGVALVGVKPVRGAAEGGEPGG
ncbi:MAG: methyltransferase domain-containing protein [Rubrobacteraceae bacterium]